MKKGNIPMIELKEITWENFWQIINLKPRESQSAYLPSNAVFMAQAYVNSKFNYPDVCFALYKELHPVGFAKIVYVPKCVEPYHFLEDSYMIDAIMIDGQHRGKGYGREALYQVLKYIESKPLGEADSIKLSCYDDNIVASSIYEKVGFSKTDKFANKEKKLRIFSKDLELESEMIRVAYLEKEIVGLVQLEPDKDTSFVVVFVSINHRNKRIGKALIKYAEDYLKEIQTKKIMTTYSINNENSMRFARKHGYERCFSSTYMKHAGGEFLSELIPVRHYCDEDYPDAFKLSTEAFHEMRVSVGDFPDSKVGEPSKQSWDEWKQDSKNRYTYFIDGEIVGHGCLEGNEIGSISVRRDMQGKGIGKRFVKYLCNELYNRGNK